ncbi:MAG: hypothetical protein HYU29_07680 [Chloroflexi bacterium]|nr:hypothetical protein [Chloroflexota bacterium]
MLGAILISLLIGTFIGVIASQFMTPLVLGAKERYKRQARQLLGSPNPSPESARYLALRLGPFADPEAVDLVRRLNDLALGH